MKITELMTTSFNLVTQLLTLMLGLMKEGTWDVGHQDNLALLSRCHKGHCVVSFYFIIIIVFFEFFHSKPDKPDWQISLCDFSSFRLHAFS